jgi:hypothetical protein
MGPHDKPSLPKVPVADAINTGVAVVRAGDAAVRALRKLRRASEAIATPGPARRAWVARGVVYIEGDCFLLARQGGTLAWRNNNPGNITSHPDAVGHDGRFVIFPDYETGFRAMVALLQSGTEPRNCNSPYLFRTIRQVFFGDPINCQGWAPPSDGNDTEAYVRNVAAAVGVPDSTFMFQLTYDQVVAVAHAIEKQEGFFDDQASQRSTLTTWC